jgi:HPt (histidine-containing phosphotransfer) domain-containing protein
VSKTPPPGGDVIDFESLCRRVLNDRELAIDLIRKANARLVTDLEQIETAVNASDFESVSKIAHKLKGSAGNLSAQPLRLACENLESAGSSGNLADVLLGFEKLKIAARDFQIMAEKFVVLA